MQSELSVMLEAAPGVSYVRPKNEMHLEKHSQGQGQGQNQ